MSTRNGSGPVQAIEAILDAQTMGAGLSAIELSSWVRQQFWLAGLALAALTGADAFLGWNLGWTWYPAPIGIAAPILGFAAAAACLILGVLAPTHAKRPNQTELWYITVVEAMVAVVLPPVTMVIYLVVAFLSNDTGLASLIAAPTWFVMELPVLLFLIGMALYTLVGVARVEQLKRVLK